MATNARLENFIREEREALRRKQEEYARLGKKPFEPPSEHWSGVMPQETYDKLRHPNDPDHPDYTPSEEEAPHA